MIPNLYLSRLTCTHARWVLRNGYFSNFYQSLPLNIDENQTVVNSYELTTFHEYIDNQVATLSIYGKAANSLGENDVKISDRLYLPVNKLRGFKPGRVGPKDGGDWVGGNYLTSLNAQANLPILQTFETMDFNVFYDAANVWGVDYSSSIDDASTIRSATGLGIDFQLINFSSNYVLSHNADTVYAVDDPVQSYKSNYLSLTRLKIPLLIEFATKKETKKCFYFSAGVIGSVRIGSYMRLTGKYDNGDKFDNTTTSKFNLNPFGLEGTVRTGYDRFGAFVSYNLLPLFKENKTVAVNPIRFGVSFNF